MLGRRRYMNKVEIRKFSHAEVDAPEEQFGFLKIPAKYTLIRAEGENLEVSDGYHTFEELYDHRITLYIALCREIASGVNRGHYKEVWRSKYHSDGELCFGTGTQFVLGINEVKGKQITYHIPIERWDETDFAKTVGKDTHYEIPEYDGHSSADVIERLKNL